MGVVGGVEFVRIISEGKYIRASQAGSTGVSHMIQLQTDGQLR
jgi:hypothetical protein